MLRIAMYAVFALTVTSAVVIGYTFYNHYTQEQQQYEQTSVVT